MTYLQAGLISVAKRLLGFMVFIGAFLSTIVSLMSFIYQYSNNNQTIDEIHEVHLVLKDFIRVFLEMIQSYSGFLNYFWKNSPLPTLGSGWSANNLLFIAIYFLIFVGLALMASGASISRQIKRVKENIQDLMILEKAKGDSTQTYQELISKARFPHHTIFLQLFRMYLLPIGIAVAVYFVLPYLKLLGF